MAVIEPGEAERDPGFHWMDALNNGKRPAGAGEARWPDAVEHMADVVYAERGGQPLLLDLVRPLDRGRGRLPVVLYIHGGGWSSGSRKSLPDAFWLFPGFIRISIDYRLTGAAPFPAQLEDCQAAIRWVRAHAEELGADPERIGVWGSSAGGHLACLLGLAGDGPPREGEPYPLHSHRVQAVVSCSGPTNLPELREWRQSVTKLMAGRLDRWIGQMKKKSPFLMKRLTGLLLNKLRERLVKGLSADSLEALVGYHPDQNGEAWRQASPLQRLGQWRSGSAAEKTGLPSFLLMHGTTDPLVPVYQSVSFYEALKSAGADAVFIPLSGYGHSTYWDHAGRFRKESVAHILRFLQNAL